MSTPMAIPVSAEWPSASEKKDIRLLTTAVPTRPNRGEISRTANRAFFIKSNSVHSKGRSVSMIPYSMSIIHLQGRKFPVHRERPALLPGYPGKQCFCPAQRHWWHTGVHGKGRGKRE